MDDQWHDIDKRVSELDRRYLSLDAKCDNAAQHSIGVDAALREVKAYLCERRKGRERWEEMRRKVMLHMVCWGLPALIGWAMLVFSGGLKSWMRLWLSE